MNHDHADTTMAVAEPGSYVGSPMYEVIPEHGLAFLLMMLGLVALWWVRRRLGRHAACEDSCWYRRYQALDTRSRFVFGLVSLSGLVHLGLVFGHGLSGYTVAYAGAAAAFGWVGRMMLLGRQWERPAKFVLIGSILGYGLTRLAGETPDQLGLLTKLLEITALGALFTPSMGRTRTLLRSTGVLSLMVFVALGSWVGALGAGEEGHHHGATPGPGMLMPAGEHREPTADEVEAADHLYQEVAAALAKFEDPEVAAEYGYKVEGMFGTDFHATNDSLKHDDRILDPEYPETLVYAMAGETPVLLGAMFEMDEPGQAGPAIGGPLTVWHAHDHVCLGFTPIGLTGLQGPFGQCPALSFNIPITNEMIHVWVLPGLDDKFGDIDHDWLKDHLDSVA